MLLEACEHHRMMVMVAGGTRQSRVFWDLIAERKRGSF